MRKVLYAFDLNEFFATNDSGKFVHEEDVKKFLHALTTQEKYPFSTPELRQELSHTMWYLNRVNSAKALEKLLREDEVFREYKVVLAAGDGRGDDDEQTAKAFDKVKDAIANYDKTITLTVGQLKRFAEAVNYLTKNGISTLDDLEIRIKIIGVRKEAVNGNLKAMSARKKELEDLLHLADLYRETKPVYDKWKGIKWKGKREDFEREHERELSTFHMTRRKLDKHRFPAGKIPVQTWRQELAEIQRKYPAEYEQYTPLRGDLSKLLQVKNCVDTVLRQQEQTQQKHREAKR